MQPVASFDRIHKFTRAVTLLQQCGRIDVQQPGSFSARSTEIIAAKSAAAAMCTAMLLGHPTARELLQRLESNLDILQVLPRINQALEGEMRVAGKPCRPARWWLACSAAAAMRVRA